jgi:predicted ABC-type transport system involved in lysophospholipase L1 biosynthesis ATPase subunit
LRAADPAAPLMIRLSAGSVKTAPVLRQRVCEDARLDAVRRVEVVAVFQEFELEIRKDRSPNWMLPFGRHRGQHRASTTATATLGRCGGDRQ